MAADEDPITASPVESKPAVEGVDESVSSLFSENVEKFPVHGPKSFSRIHERFYFKDGNITFMVCNPVTFTTLEWHSS